MGSTSKHSDISPSKLAMVRGCPGSMEEARGLPDPTSEFAIEGSVFHEVAADCLEYGVDPFSFIGSKIEIEEDHGVEVREFTRTMANHMMPGLIVARALMDGPYVMVWVEKRVDISPWMGFDAEGNPRGGTSDLFIIDLARNRIIIWDWKYGAGVPVHPEWNDQAIAYFLGVWNDYAREIFEQDLLDNGGDPNAPWEDSIRVEFYIEQPRAPGGGGFWETTVGALLQEGDKIRRDIERAETPGAPRIPGEKQCKFCPAARANTCAARAERIADMIGQDFDDLEDDFDRGDELVMPDMRAISPKARSQLLLNQKVITDWLKQLHEEAVEDAHKGNEVPGMKLVAGRRPGRKWRNEKMAAAVLEHEFSALAWNRSLRSPADIESEVGKENYRRTFAPLVEEGVAKAILVPETHKGERLKTVDEKFDDMFDDD